MGQISLTLWESNIGMLKVDKSYSLNNVLVKEYAPFLTLTRDDSTVQELRMLDRWFYLIC